MLHRIRTLPQRLFPSVQGNSRVIVFTEGACAVPYQWLGTYLPLYMVALGVGKVELGLLASLLSAVQLLSTLIGGYMADRFGRKRVLVVGDIIAWGIPLTLFAIARNPWYFWVGNAINGWVYVVVPSFQCLFVEDVAPEDRPAVFSALQLLSALASLFSPLAGLMVARLGIIGAGRIIAGLTAMSAVGTAVFRQFTLRETTIGQARISAHARSSRREVLREYLKTLQSMGRSPAIRSFLTVRILDAFSAAMWGTYAALYLTDAAGLGLAKATVSLLPFIAAIATIAILLVGFRALTARRSLDNLIAGQMLWLAAALCFAASPAGTLVFVLLYAVFQAIARALIQPAIESHWANIVGEWERAQVFAVSSALSSLCVLPAGLIAGGLYVLWPRAPFLLAIALQALSLTIVLWLRRVAHPVAVQTE